MIRQTEEPTRTEVPEPVLGGYRLSPAPRRLEGGSLLFSATAADGSPASMQVSAELVTSRRARARFRRLARTRAKLSHPALLGVRESGEESGRLFVATEPFPAGSLALRLRGAPLDPQHALRLLRPVAEGLDAAHAEGLVHRTLSADSVLMDGEQAKLDLFGLFTVAGQASWGDVVRRDAHLHYQSPEGVRGEELTPASNVYSLTGLLVHALTGQQPFVNHDPVMITYAHVSQPPPKPSERIPELPAALDDLVARGMAKEPDERPQSAAALIAEAEKALHVVAPPVAPVGPQPARSQPAALLHPSQPPVSEPADGDVVSDVAARIAARVAAPTTPAPAPVAPKAMQPPPPTKPIPQAEAPKRPTVPLRARLVQFGPLLGVIAIAAIFGLLLGMPSSSPEQAARQVPSANEQAAKRLDEVRFRLRDDLAIASTPKEQAGLAGRLAIAYGRAADQMSSSELVSASHEASLAYTSLQSAARSGDAAAYDRARDEVESAESAMSDKLAQVRPQKPSE